MKKVYDEITDDEIQEIWNKEEPEDGEPVRLNGKCVWAAAKRVCDFINAHEDIIKIETFVEGDKYQICPNFQNKIKTTRNY